MDRIKYHLRLILIREGGSCPRNLRNRGLSLAIPPIGKGEISGVGKLFAAWGNLSYIVSKWHSCCDLSFNKYRLSSLRCGHRGTHKTTSAIKGAVVVTHYATEVLADAESLGHAFVPLAECCGRVWWCTPPYLGSPVTPHVASIFFSLKAHKSYILFSLHSFSFTFIILIFFYPNTKFWK